MQTIEAPSLRLPLFNALNHRLITVTVLPERENSKILQSTYFSPKNMVRAFKHEEFYSPEVQAELAKQQTAGCGIFYSINEGDGIPYDPKTGNLNCGKKQNIQSLTTLVIDTDNTPVADIKLKLAEIKLQPHLVIESSPNKFHIYFFIKKVKRSFDLDFQWRALQKLLHSLCPNMDQSMADLNQLLRIPGFYNLKPKLPEPFKVRQTFFKSDLPFYDLTFLYERLEAHKYKEEIPDYSEKSLNGNYINGTSLSRKEYKRFEFKEDIGQLTDGERHDTINRYIASIVENVIHVDAREEQFLQLIDAFIIRNIFKDGQAVFLPKGNRRDKVLQSLHSQIKKVKLEIDERKSFLANEKFDHLDAVQSSKLDDSFYLNFPGDLGFIVREIHDYAPNLALEMCFAGALIISGALKAETFRLKGLWPFINGIIVAGTGAGKSTLKDVVERTLIEAGLGGKYPQLIHFQNTVQSLHTSLYAAGGVGTVIVDEAGDYLQNITSKNNQPYTKGLKKYFKEATTCRSKGARLHPGGSLTYQVPLIDGGMLNLWLLMQPDKFMGSLSIEDMSDGFLPRFFVFNGRTNLALDQFSDIDKEDKTFEPSVDFKVFLESFIHIRPQVDIVKACEEAEKELKESFKNKLKLDVLVSAKRDAVYQARSEARHLSSIPVVFEPGAIKIVKDYLVERQKEAKAVYDDKGEDAPAIAIFIRMKEMLFRLMCNAAPKEAVVSVTLATECVKFHRFQIDRAMSNEYAEVVQGTGEREQQIVLHTLTRLYLKNGRKPLSSKQVSMGIKGTRRPKNITGVLAELVKSGEATAESIDAKTKQNKVISGLVYRPVGSDPEERSTEPVVGPSGPPDLNELN